MLGHKLGQAIGSRIRRCEVTKLGFIALIGLMRPVFTRHRSIGGGKRHGGNAPLAHCGDHGACGQFYRVGRVAETWGQVEEQIGQKSAGNNKINPVHAPGFTRTRATGTARSGREDIEWIAIVTIIGAVAFRKKGALLLIQSACSACHPTSKPPA